MSGFEPLRLDVSYLHHKELNLVANTRYRNSRNRTDTYNQTVDNPIIKALPLPFSNHGSCS
ncbi:TPA: hypothetical protein U5145_001252 [Streptococcus agalactiae]|nr:hypothetical protein [Streptococcus agalactiae]HEN4703871.1 hypothetical protein [Streptococcus agalactiae]HEO7700231.1 hypothetical protein [Streptococcus agalactiae]